MKSECAGIESIVIFYPDDYGLHPAPNIFIHGQKLSYSECEELAENDGFESFSDFCTYFNNNFEGKIIHWTDKKYAALTSAEIDALLWA
ncbi:hypothetical protein [Leptospira mayottensis]|nr:hypothetical protein [Leptospira mayottensis]